MCVPNTGASVLLHGWTDRPCSAVPACGGPTAGWYHALTRCAVQGDQGGERVLQRRWTTFLKAQLLCSHPEDGFPFNVLQDIFVLTPAELRWRETLFYGVFTSQW